MNKEQEVIGILVENSIPIYPDKIQRAIDNDDLPHIAKSINVLYQKEIDRLNKELEDTKKKLWWVTEGWKEEANRDEINNRKD